MLSSDRKGHEFLIYDKDFNTFVHLDGDTQIEHLSKILIRTKSDGGHTKTGHTNNHHTPNNLAKTPSQSLKGDRNQSESIVISINPNDLASQSNSQTNLLIGQSNSQMSSQMVSQMSQRNNQMHGQFDSFSPVKSSSQNSLRTNKSNSINTPAAGSNVPTSNLLNNSGFVPVSSSPMIAGNLTVSSSAYGSTENYDEVSNVQNYEDGQDVDVEWPEDDAAVLLECCQPYAQNFALYNISIDPIFLDEQDDNELWEQISAKVRRGTKKSYSKGQCKSKFLELRTKYINVKAYSGLEGSYFCQVKYFTHLKQLIDGLKPSIDQLNGQLKTRNLQRSKLIGSKDKNSYLSLIQQVKAFARQFNDGAVSKNSVWNEIANNLNNEGYRVTGKSCQGLFHRLRYSYLHLLKTISTEDEGQERWPYFHAFSVGFSIIKL